MANLMQSNFMDGSIMLFTKAVSCFITYYLRRNPLYNKIKFLLKGSEKFCA